MAGNLSIPQVLVKDDKTKREKRVHLAGPNNDRLNLAELSAEFGWPLERHCGDGQYVVFRTWYHDPNLSNATYDKETKEIHMRSLEAAPGVARTFAPLDCRYNTQLLAMMEPAELDPYPLGIKPVYMASK